MDITGTKPIWYLCCLPTLPCKVVVGRKFCLFGIKVRYKVGLFGKPIHVKVLFLMANRADTVVYCLAGWLFWAKRSFETVFESISGRLPERGRKKKNDRRKNHVKKTPAPTASAVGPCPTLLQSSRTTRHW